MYRTVLCSVQWGPGGRPSGVSDWWTPEHELVQRDGLAVYRCSEILHDFDEEGAVASVRPCFGGDDVEVEVAVVP